MTEMQRATYLEIRRLLAEAYEHFFADSESSWKSSEGYVEIGYPNIFDEREGANVLEATHIGIYSYALGPLRMHFFDTFEEALGTVRKWHAAEMSHPVSVEGGVEPGNGPVEAAGENPA